MKINVNGITLHYKKTGQGSPIILLHGNGQDHTIFKAITKKMSDKHTVYALDSRGHGESSKVKHHDYQAIMEDVVEFIQKLEIEKPVLYGFSDGGIIGLLIAINHPQMLSKLLISGANTQPDGIKKRMVLLMKVGYFFTRSKNLKMMLTQPDISNEQLNTIITPTLVLAGKHDLIKQEHTINIAMNIKDSKIKILKDENHFSYVLDNKKLYELIKTFIEE